MKDYDIVDFRVSDDGEPTTVQRQNHRVSVLFKNGDFSQWKCGGKVQRY